MPDSPLERMGSGPYDSGMEARVTRLEEDVRTIKDTVIRLETLSTATFPHLATKADVGEKPSKTCMWGILAALLTAYACGLAALAILK
ncbi:MAG: hypothetical protein P4L71_18560 [Acetobacteraceae bacterium]|nr:hypothetical protein [Acetobacteraceae bacterium]